MAFGHFQPNKTLEPRRSKKTHQAICATGIGIYKNNSRKCRSTGDSKATHSISNVDGCQLSCSGPISIKSFVSKLAIVVEEADETVFWLELVQDAKLSDGEELNFLLKEATELLYIFLGVAQIG